MRLWRISSYPGLAGIGGLHAAGRWHSLGRHVLYASEHPALAMVETLAHMRLGLTAIPLTLKLIAIDVAEGARVSPAPALPGGWQANEPTSQAAGDSWLAGGSGLLLPVPSALIAHSINYVINPVHAQAATHLSEGEILPFWFDKRYLR
jgi:RES domain-containing protein